MVLAAHPVRLIGLGGGHMNNAPERIYNWQHNQMSIARHYGGLTYQGHIYTIAPQEQGQPLVRADVIKREAKEAIAKRKADKQAAQSKQSTQGALL